MRRSRFITLAAVLALAAAGCGGGSDGNDDDPTLGGGGPATSTNAAPPTTAAAGPTTTAIPAGPVTNLTVRATGLRLLNAEESDNGLRILLPAGVATASVTLSGLPTPNQVISVCQAGSLDNRLTGATCRMPANGEAVDVALGSVASGVEVVQVGVAGSGPSANAATLDEVVIRYAAPSRELRVRMPQIAAGEAGSRPTFALSPASVDGAYRAQLTWTIIPVFGGGPGLGQIELLKGGSVVNQAQSGADTRLSGSVPPPVADAAIRVLNAGQSALVTPKLTVLLP